MRRIIYFQIATFALSLLSVGCYKDDSIPAQVDMPNIEFDLENPQSIPSVLAYVGEEFEFEIPIIWNDNDPGAFDFKWIIDNEVISTDQVLRRTFLYTGKYYMTYQVIERATGLAIGTRTQLMIGSKYLVGWLILSDKGGRSALDFIHVDTHELYPDIYHNFYPDDPLGSEPSRLVDHCMQEYDQVIVIQKGGPGLVALDGRNFEKVIRIEDEFIGEKYPYPNFNPVDIYITKGKLEILLTDKGEAYSRSINSTNGSSGFQTAQFPSVPMDYPDGKGMEVVYYTFPGAIYFFTLFDGLNNRWLAVKKAIQTYEVNIMLPTWEKAFDVDDPSLPIEGPEFFDFCEGMDPKIKLVFAQSSYQYSNNSHFVNILKDTESGKYYFQKTLIKYESSPRERIVISSPMQYEFAPGYAVNDDSQFCMLRGLLSRYNNNPHIFFTVGNKLYFYRLRNDNIYLLKDFDMVDNPPTGKVVAIMQSPGPSPDYHQKISVAFSDGHFFILNCTTVIEDIVNGVKDATNPADAAEIEIVHYSGLGEIKHAIFKYGRWQNWVSEVDRDR